MAHSALGSFLPGRLAYCKSQGCDLGKAFLNYMFTNEDEKRGWFPAGDYRLYLLADGEPVEITLRLRELEGSVHLSPSEPAAIDFKTLTDRLTTSSDGSLFVAGDTFKGGTSGIMLASLFFRTDSAGAYNYGICNYTGPVAPPPEIAYGPHCTALAFAGAGAGAFNYLQAGRGMTLVFLTDYSPNVFPPSIDGQEGLGAWVTTSANIERAGSHAFFLNWDE